MSTSALPKTIKALVHNLKTQTLKLASIDFPTPSSIELLTRVHAVTLSAGELYWPRPGDVTDSIPGVEFAGEIVTSLPASRFHPGDQVYARTTFPRLGSAREYSVAEEHELALKPSNLSWEEAVSVPMSAQTAWQALFIHGGLAAPKAGAKSNENASKRILVLGASGGCGIWTVQLAKATGAYVVGTCGPSNEDFVRGLGADEVLNYSIIGPKAWAQGDAARKVDLVVDCVGGNPLDEAWTAIKDGGLLLTIVPLPGYVHPTKPSEGVGKDVKGVFFIMSANGTQLEQITTLIEKGICKPVVDSVWEFNAWEKALKKVEGGHARGKVVLRISE